MTWHNDTWKHMTILAGGILVAAFVEAMITGLLYLTGRIDAVLTGNLYIVMASQMGLGFAMAIYFSLVDDWCYA